MSEMLEKLRTRSMAFVHDLIMIPWAWFIAYWLRFNLSNIPQPMLDHVLKALVVIIPMQAGVFWYFGLYRGVWRFASIPDLVRIVKAVFVGLALCMITLFITTRLAGVPRSVPILYGLLLVIFLSGPRFLYRWIKEHRFNLRSGQRVLIAGAGRAGEMLARDLLRNRQQAYQPIVFVDDDSMKRGKEIHGVRVVGACKQIPTLVKELAIDVIMIAIPSASSREMRRMVELCERARVPFRTVPKLDDLMSGQVKINELREVSIEDLLGREPISLDWKTIDAGLSQKTILVSGAGGSIGSELCRQIARLQPSRLILLENSEFNLYTIEMELRRDFQNLDLYSHLGDVRDENVVFRISELYRPQIIFHAAAYKHVPLLEREAREAIRNNVIGTRNMAQAASRFGCDEFVLISTDKAVNPTSIMGTSKRIAEIYCQNFNGLSSTRFITVRFGNVLASAGSVVPLFRKQIAAGGPVTVTHPKMERYFMTIPEACQLIMQAAVIGKGGEIFVLDMGEPVRISYLAEQMIRLSGKVPNEDIKIQYIGTRPGEKLYEELFHGRERLRPTDHNKILLARHRVVDWQILQRVLDEMNIACDQEDIETLMERMALLVPETKINWNRLEDQQHKVVTLPPKDDRSVAEAT